MKRKILLAAIIALVLNLGTFFVDSNPIDKSVSGCEGLVSTCIDGTNTVERGFPFSYLNEADKIVSAEIERNVSFDVPALALNLMSWFIISIGALIFLDWLAGFLGKIAIRLIAGLAITAYSLFVILG